MTTSRAPNRGFTLRAREPVGRERIDGPPASSSTRALAAAAITRPRPSRVSVVPIAPGPRPTRRFAVALRLDAESSRRPGSPTAGASPRARSARTAPRCRGRAGGARRRCVPRRRATWPPGAAAREPERRRRAPTWSAGQRPDGQREQHSEQPEREQPVHQAPGSPFEPAATTVQKKPVAPRLERTPARHRDAPVAPALGPGDRLGPRVLQVRPSGR